jgi:hypothetical protein
MLRTVGSVILGYIVIAAFVLLSFSLVYVAMGPDRAYQPGTYEVSALWVVVSIVLSFIAAVLGGWACVLVARTQLGPQILAAAILVFGLVLAVMQLGSAPADLPTVRDASVGVMEAMRNSRNPTWINFVTPLVAVVGILAGARLVGRKPDPVLEI